MVEAVEYERAEQQLVQVVLWRRAYSPRIAYVGVSPVRVVGLVRSLKTDGGGGDQDSVCRDLFNFIFLISNWLCFPALVVFSVRRDLI